MDKKERYEKAAGDFKDRSEIINLNRYPRNTYEASINFADIKPSDCLLKIGTGMGFHFDYYLKKTKNIYALDISERNINFCKNKYGDKVKFEVHDIDERTNYKDETFDYIVGVDVIEHLHNRYNPMEEFHRILKPGGRLLIVTPNFIKLRNRIKFLFGKYPSTSTTVLQMRLYDGGHMQLFSFKTLRELGEQTGFKLVREYGFGRFGRIHNIFRSIMSGSICMIFKKIEGDIDLDRKCVKGEQNG